MCISDLSKYWDKDLGLLGQGLKKETNIRLVNLGLGQALKGLDF